MAMTLKNNRHRNILTDCKSIIPTDQNPLHIIYAGGTFGCVGTPLAPLTSTQFFNAFAKVYRNLSTVPWCAIDNPIIKDSSCFCAKDFIYFDALIKNTYQKHKTDHAPFYVLIITGTDTLSYLSAFLSISLAHLNICVMLVASMSPLFMQNNDKIVPKKQTDAYQNLQNALKFLQNNHTGVFVSVNNTQDTPFWGEDIQKIHANAQNAFVGSYFNGQKPTAYYPNFKTALHNDCTVYNVYAMPNCADILAQQLEFLVQHKANVVILIGFGAGNLPRSDRLSIALDKLFLQNTLLIMTKPTPFGTCDTSYEAGAWQAMHGVQTSKNLTLSQIYAHSAWICLHYNPTARIAAWQNMIKKL